jgi:hypothetical protein
MIGEAAHDLRNRVEGEQAEAAKAGAMYLDCDGHVPQALLIYAV